MRLSRCLLAMVLAALNAVTFSQQAHAREICWIDSVKRTENGVEVYFAHSRTVIVKGAQPSRVVEVNSVPPQDRPPSNAGIPLIPSLALLLGDHVMIWTIHDSCTLDVVNKDDRIGVQAAARLNLPNLPPASADAFIAAK
jgi:hypothetical protein